MLFLSIIFTGFSDIFFRVKVQKFLKAKPACGNDTSGFNAHITIMPRLKINAGHLLFKARIAEDKAEICGICTKPPLFRRLVKIVAHIIVTLSAEIHSKPGVVFA